MPQLSAIVPLYNKAPFVLRTLTSMASQSYRDFEVIVVNDGSTDGGDEVARTFSDSRFRVIDQPNAGPGAARNRGLAEARGPLVAFLDADDEWYPEYLQRAVEFLARRPDVAAVSQFYVEAPDRSTEPMWRRRRLMDGTQNMGTLTAELLHYMVAYMTPPATVARTEVLRRWGGFYEQRCTFGEDSFLWLKILLNEPVEFLMKPGALVHRESGALSQNLRGARPLEPFLAHPELAADACPPHLLPVLHGFYALRAFKTACVWGYHGDWRRAAEVRRRFRMQGDFRLPFYVSSWVCSTPAGAALSALWRWLPLPRQSNGRQTQSAQTLTVPQLREHSPESSEQPAHVVRARDNP